MEDDLLVLGAHEVVDDVRGGGVAPGVAEPFGADQAFDDGCGRVDSAVAGEVG